MYPRQDYIGPYNIYLERSANTTVINNTLICGQVTSKRYIPLQISGGSSTCLVRGNKFVDAGNQNVFALVGTDETTIYENNDCDFIPPTYFFCYNSEEPTLYVTGCKLEASKQIISYHRNSIPKFVGTLSMSDCEMKAPQFNSSSSKDEMDWSFTRCTFTGKQFLLDYNVGETNIDDCTFTNVQKVAEIRYGSGRKTIKNSKVISDNNQSYSIVCHVRGGNYELINISSNTINIDNGVLFKHEDKAQLNSVVCTDNQLFGKITIGIAPKKGKFTVERNIEK